MSYTRRSFLKGAAGVLGAAALTTTGASKILGAHCPNCGASVSGNYCPYCGAGEKNIEPVRIEPNGSLYSWTGKASLLNVRGASYIEGIASSETQDMQEDIVLQSGMDFRPFTNDGFISWNGSPQASHQIGIPVKVSNVLVNGVPSLYVKAKLFNNMPVAQTTVKLMRALENVPDKAVGFAIMGHVVERKDNYITRSVVKHVFLTHEPVNPDVYARLV